MEPARHDAPAQEQQQEQRRAEALASPDVWRLMRVLAARTVLFWPVDVLSAMKWTWDTLVLRGLWAGLMMALAWKVQRSPELNLERVRFVAAVLLPNVFVALIVQRLGGTQSPLFASFCLLPVFGLMIPWSRGWEGVLRVVLPMVSASGVMLWEGTPPARMASWLLVMLSAGTLGVHLSRYHQRLRLAWGKVMEEQREQQRELEESRERALRAERLAQVGRLAAGVAHEVRNPLAYVQANLRFLLEEWRQSATSGDHAEEFSEALTETMQGVDRIHQIVKDLTMLSRGEDTPVPALPCALGPIIDTSVRLASVRLKSLVKLDVRVEGTPQAVVEPRRLGQVLLNLLLNAADAIEDAKVLDGRVAVRVEQVGERVRVLVEDNGPGIQAENLSKLFTTFFTTKAPEKGTGLGLALSRQYVESFGGTLSAENRAEGGARFIVDLRPG